MRVLVACETSGVVRDAFRARGHEAWSCDLLPATGHHFHCSVFDVIYDMTWDLLIAHPPCTYLCASGMHWTTRGLRDPALTRSAAVFVGQLWNAPIERICIENPVGSINRLLPEMPRPQYIQPYLFGEDASKKTGLWLRNLPPLVYTMRVPGRMVGGKERWANQTDSGQNRLGPSEKRWQERSRTYPGIARAMAAQWG